MVPIPYSTPPNFVAGAVLTEANLDVLSDDISFLANPPRCRVYNSANISIPNNTDTALTFDSERFDTDTMHSTAVNTGRITFTTGGVYEVGASVSFPSSTGIRSVVVALNGVTSLVGQRTTALGGGFADILSCSTIYSFSAADYITVIVYQSSGAALNVSAASNYSPEAWAILRAVA